VADAGMGKSRLVGEVVKVARQRGFHAVGGQAQSFGTNTTYLAWWGVWRGFFRLDQEERIGAHAAAIAAQLLEMNPALLPRLPLLGAVLNLALPDNDTTRSLDAKVRKASLESLLVECLRHRAERSPMLILLEDGHWLDPLSRDLVEVFAHAVEDLRAAGVVASR